MNTQRKHCDTCGTLGLIGEVQEAYEDGPEVCGDCYAAIEEELGCFMFTEPSQALTDT